jgi:hypothetical protein
VENKRITTEGHGATRKDSVYKFVASVKIRGEIEVGFIHFYKSADGIDLNLEP